MHAQAQARSELADSMGGLKVGGAPTIIVIEVQGACKTGKMSSDGSQSGPERSLSVPLTMDRGLPPSEFPPVLVMYHPRMEALARSLVKTVNDHNMDGKVDSTKFVHPQQSYSVCAKNIIILSKNIIINVVVGQLGHIHVHDVQDLKYRRVELFDGIDWQHFRDGWPNIFIKNVKLIAGRDGQSIRDSCDLSK